MHIVATSAIHLLPAGTTSSIRTALPLMTAVAAHLARLRTTPPRRQSVSIGPKALWLSSQARRRGELLAAAQADSRMKGTVGNTGTKMPTNPSARLTNAKAMNKPRTMAGKGAAVWSVESQLSSFRSGIPHFAVSNVGASVCLQL